MLDSRPIAELWPIAEAVLEKGGYFRLWPRGRSMRPLLREGADSVLLALPSDIKKGDILLIRTPKGSFLLHRALSVTELGIVTRGDALLHREGPFPPEAVLAKVVRVYRKDRALSRPALALFAVRAAVRRTLFRLLGRK